MVLGDLLSPDIAERKPIYILPIAFLYSTIGIFLALWIFPSHAALVAVFLTTFACMPLMLNVIKFEKDKEEGTRDYLRRLVFFFNPNREALKIKNLIKMQTSQDMLLPFFTFLFLGMALAFTLWFVVMPQDILTNLFYVQINTIKQINIGVSGGMILGLIILIYFWSGSNFHINLECFCYWCSNWRFNKKRISSFCRCNWLSWLPYLY